jgi:predicted nucleic acid-binding protein
MVILLDTFPMSSVAKRPGAQVLTLSDECRQWIHDCEAAGHRVLAPAIAYYEALRELEQRQAASQITRLKAFCLQPRRFVPLTTAQLEAAAQMWGQARRAGRPTAPDQALDADAILAAQALGLELPASDYVVATTNVAHLSRFVPAADWSTIAP